MDFEYNVPSCVKNICDTKKLKNTYKKLCLYFEAEQSDSYLSLLQSSWDVVHNYNLYCMYLSFKYVSLEKKDRDILDLSIQTVSRMQNLFLENLTPKENMELIYDIVNDSVIENFLIVNTFVLPSKNKKICHEIFTWINTFLDTIDHIFLIYRLVYYMSRDIILSEKNFKTDFVMRYEMSLDELDRCRNIFRRMFLGDDDCDDETAPINFMKFFCFLKNHRMTYGLNIYLSSCRYDRLNDSYKLIQFISSIPFQHELHIIKERIHAETEYLLAIYDFLKFHDNLLCIFNQEPEFKEFHERFLSYIPYSKKQLRPKIYIAQQLEKKY